MQANNLTNGNSGQLVSATGEQLELPRGVRVFHEQGRPMPYGCQWRVDGKRKTRFFPSAEKRDKYADGLAKDLKQSGLDAYRLDPSEMKQFRALKAALGEDVKLDRLIECWKRYGRRVASITIAEGVEQFLAAKKEEGVTPSALGHYRSVFKTLAVELGAVVASDVTREDVAAWLANPKTAVYTKRTHLARARGLFSWLRTNRYVAESPCDGIKPPRIVQAEVGILTVAQCRSLFAYNEDESPEFLARLASEAFCGLRFASACALAREDIDFSARGISLPAAKIKTRRRQYIDALPENLWAWLERAKDVPWKMTPRQYLHAKGRAFMAAGIKRAPHNSLRHSFATYHIAANRDVAKTVLILCHTSPKMLWQHYKGRATEADGLAYFQIYPKTHDE